MTCKNSINWQGADIQGVIRVFDMGATVFFQNGLRDELVTREDALFPLLKGLDEAVFAAYGWPNNLSDEEIVERSR